jgi:hypothetical protein
MHEDKQRAKEFMGQVSTGLRADGKIKTQNYGSQGVQYHQAFKGNNDVEVRLWFNPESDCAHVTVWRANTKVSDGYVKVAEDVVTMALKAGKLPYREFQAIVDAEHERQMKRLDNEIECGFNLLRVMCGYKG